MKKLNARGIAHEMAMVAFVVLFAISGVAYMVASRAAVCEPVSSAVSEPTSSAVSAAVCEPVSSATSSAVSEPTPQPAPAPIAAIPAPAPQPAPAPSPSPSTTPNSPSSSVSANAASKTAGSCVIKNTVTRQGKVATNNPQVTIYNKGNQPFYPAIAYTATQTIGRKNVAIDRKAISSSELQPGQKVTKQLGAIQSSISKQTVNYRLLIKSNSPQFTCSGTFISTSKSPSTF